MFDFIPINAKLMSKSSRMKQFYILLLFALVAHIVPAQSVSTLMGARAQGIGYASSALFDTWGIFNNIAGTAKHAEATAAFAYDLRTAIPGANRTALALAIPMKLGVISSGVFRFGDDLYSESILSAGFSNQLGLAALGVKVNYIQYRTEGFGSKGVFTLNAGGIAELTPNLFIGAYITNINQPDISSDDDRLPTLLTAGISFRPTDKVIIATELEKDLDYDVTWKMGLEYAFQTKFCVRTGYNIGPNASFFGLGFKTTKFFLDYALQYSTLLNFSHQASVSYLFSKK
jgi:hypothetical protein